MKAILFAALMLAATAAVAACYSHSFTYNGRTVFCTTCCSQAGCMTSCV